LKAVADRDRAPGAMGSVSGGDAWREHAHGRPLGSLHVHRAPAGMAPGDAACLVGGLAYGLGARAAGLGQVPAIGRPGAACVDAFLGSPVVDEGRCGAVRWRHDGHWLFGQIALNEPRHEQGGSPACSAVSSLEALAYQAYGDVFATLGHTGFAHLQRLWNYVPHINADGGGLERYRQFNSGRQRAFLDAGQAAFDGAPAACALGVGDAPLCVNFLAGRRRPLPIENPRQVSAYRYPPQFGPRSPSFSRAALAEVGDGRLALWISGTASIVGHDSRHPGDVRAQTGEALANLRAVIDAARARCDADFALARLQPVVYVREPADQAIVREELEQALGADAPMLRDAVWLQADICRRELLVEIEAHAILPGRLHADGDPA
jgi:enamine deaminase RidA (YjgF/YER057c/UK114 family)